MPDTAAVRRPREWSWQGATALLLALGIFLGETILCIGEAYKLTRGIELSNAGINLITATLSQLVGASAIYIGGRAFAAANTSATPAPPTTRAADKKAAGNDADADNVDTDVNPEPTKNP